MFFFLVLPVDLYIVRAMLLLCGNSLRSDRSVLVKCALWQKDRSYVIGKLFNLRVSFHLDTSSINKERVGWIRV